MWNTILQIRNTGIVKIHVPLLLSKCVKSPKLRISIVKPLIIYQTSGCYMQTRAFRSTLSTLQETVSTLQIKKRPVRKKFPLEPEELQQPGIYNVLAFSTAEEYNLDALKKSLKLQNLYEPCSIEHLPDVLYAVAKDQVCKEPREVFFFREGSVVFWNVAEVESNNMINFLKLYEQKRYSEKLVQGEVELMKYRHQVDGKSIIIQTTGEILIAPKDNVLEKYTFSNSLASSVKLGIWEATLDTFIDSIEYITGDLKSGAKIKMSIDEVLRKHGELYGLRHLINLSSDLLDTPDFYWEHEELERLYLQGYAYFSIGRRTKVINEKINHCIELIELLSRHLSDRHHVRLEWMVIALITIEVFFEALHYIERYLSH